MSHTRTLHNLHEYLRTSAHVQFMQRRLLENTVISQHVRIFSRTHLGIVRNTCYLFIGRYYTYTSGRSARWDWSTDHKILPTRVHIARSYHHSYIVALLTQRLQKLYCPVYGRLVQISDFSRSTNHGCFCVIHILTKWHTPPKKIVCASSS